MDIKILILYSVILLINIIVNIHFYFNSRKKQEYLWTLLFWCGVFIHFICQGAFEHHHQLLGITYSVAAVSFMCMLKVFGSLFNAPVDIKLYTKINVSLFVLGVGLSFVAPFQVFTVPIVLMNVIPFYHFAYKHWKSINKAPLFLRCGFYFFCISMIHIMDYPFLRLKPEAAEIGFFVAFMSTILFSLIVHFVSDSIYIKAIEDELKKSIEEKNKLLQNLMAIELITAFSHEINNSLQSMESSNELIGLMAEKNNNEKIANLSSNINKGLGRIFTMFDLFNDSKRQDAYKEESLPEIIKESVSLVDVRLKSSQINFSLASIPEVKIWSSKGVFVQVIENILSQIINSGSKTVKVNFEKNIISFSSEAVKDSLNLELAYILCSQIDVKMIVEHNKVLLFYKDKSVELESD